MKINEVFYSLQGEGYFSGVPAVFVRFSGCNLKCPFCDTTHDDGKEMTVDEIIEAVSKYPAKHVVLTGGEPSLFIKNLLIDRLHSEGRYVAIETNGTRNINENIDWITLSPKIAQTHNAQLNLTKCDELKLIFQTSQQTDEIINILKESGLLFPKQMFLQPCDTGNAEKNKKIIADCVSYCKSHSQWRLSLQIHKIIDIK